MESHDIDLTEHGRPGVPKFRAKFGRVTVVLGANGSGKSRLLELLQASRLNSFGGSRPCIAVEGGRVVSLPNQIGLDQNTVTHYATYKQALTQHTKKSAGKITHRINDALLVLERLVEEEKITHSDAVDRWQCSGKEGLCPSRKEPPLDRLFRLFNQVLPYLTLRFDRPNLYACKGEDQYQVSNLSDGEKQVLAILADIGMLSNDNSLIFVDEPELNLHPILATQLWSAIEADRPNCVFVYATHSINFALRSGVDRLIVLSSSNPPIEVSNLSAVDDDTLRPFLGAIPAILRSSRALVVEGEDASFDTQFYRWVLDEPSTEIVGLGDCHQVVSATRRTGLWSSLATGLQVTGVVDRDFRSARQLAELSTPTCHVLDLHEAESYLCVPDLLFALAQKLKLVNPLPTVETIGEAIFAFVREQTIKTAAARTFARASLNLAVSVPRNALATATDRSSAITLLRRAATSEVEKAKNVIDPVAIEA